jgi:hypothetical protein
LDSARSSQHLSPSLAETTTDNLGHRRRSDDQLHASTPWRRRSIVQPELEQDEVQPSTKLGTDIRHASHLHKAKLLMEPNRHLILTINGSDHRMFATFPRLID